ncbi:MAG: hypothetical protein KF901_31280 [Myxococcales bacterium]|nr:hypothetical protein [Myxococcales bacterium]
MKRALVVILVSLSLPWLVGSGAQAQSAAISLAEIREQILYARYDDAIMAARRFLEREDLGASERALGLEVLAIAHVANRDQQAADATLRELYRRDPGHRLSDGDASPLVQGAFQRARERLPATIDVRMTHEVPTLAGRESPLVEVRVTEGLEAVQEVRIAYRTGGSPRFANLVLNADGEIARGRLPLVGGPQEEQRIEYFVLALAPSGTPLAQIGDEAEPLVIVVPPAGASDRAVPLTDGPGQPQEARRSKWWIGLLVVVAAAAGAGVGLYFALRDDAPSGTLGGVGLQF